MNNFDMLAREWEGAILSSGESLLIIGGDSGTVATNNCQCRGNNCNCGVANNCDCGDSTTGNNCKCGGVIGSEIGGSEGPGHTIDP